MRRFFSKLVKGFRKTRPQATKQGPRRAFLQVEGLENRELLSASPLLDPIQAKYQSLGGRNGFMGPALTGEMPTPYGGGLYEVFAGGAISYSPATGAHETSPITLSKWSDTAAMHGSNGEVVQKILGLPTADIAPLPGTSQAFITPWQGGDIKYSRAPSQNAADNFPHVLYGAIAAEYAATAHEFGANGVAVQKILGVATSDETNVPGVPGARMNTFQGGAIYWSPSTGAHVVYGGIGAKYNGVGGPAAYGLPISDEASVPTVSGERVSHFQGGRDIYWTATTGAHLVYGAIRNEYLATANERDFFGRNVQTLLGAPTSDEMNVPGVPGARMNTFQGGTIYWSPSTGAHVVYGAIAAKYNSIGGPTSLLGLPTTDELNLTGASGRVSIFQFGRIVWTPAGGAVVQ
jgi:uncharacterized protein with LGFP repeats